MRKRREEVQTMRKISNAKEIRELLEERRERTIDKIIEKNNFINDKNIDKSLNTTSFSFFTFKTLFPNTPV